MRVRVKVGIMDHIRRLVRVRDFLKVVELGLKGCRFSVNKKVLDHLERFSFIESDLNLPVPLDDCLNIINEDHLHLVDLTLSLVKLCPWRVGRVQVHLLFQSTTEAIGGPIGGEPGVGEEFDELVLEHE